jgi:CRP-like cAMP-binding protein
MFQSGFAHPNELLSSLPTDQLALLMPYMTPESISRGTVLIEAGDEVDFVYFPHSGMVSLLEVLADGRAIETETVGREGALGVMAGLGSPISLVRVVVQMRIETGKIPARRFRQLAGNSEAIQALCIHQNDVLLSKARVTAACNAVHEVEARFCRWILQTVDHARGDVAELTHEFLAEMLGVRRTSVTEVAGKVQRSGAIVYSRGTIKIRDRQALEAMSCDCYTRQKEHGLILARSYIARQTARVATGARP